MRLAVTGDDFVRQDVGDCEDVEESMCLRNRLVSTALWFHRAWRGHE